MNEMTALARPTLTVGEVAEESGVATSAVRFYERQGLISSSRTSGNQRRYDAFVPCLLRVARVAQRVGLTVQEINEVFVDLPEQFTQADWQRVSDQLVAEAESRIASLRGVLTDLASDERLCSLPGVRR